MNSIHCETNLQKKSFSRQVGYVNLLLILLKSEAERQVKI